MKMMERRFLREAKVMRGIHFIARHSGTFTIPEKIDLIKSIEKKVLAADTRITTLNYCMLQDFSEDRLMAK